MQLKVQRNGGKNRKRLYTTGKGDCAVTREKIGRPEGENDIKKN